MSQHEARKLRSGLDLQHAGKDRSAGDVACDPEFVITYVFDPDATGSFLVAPDHLVEVSHVAPMRVDGLDRFDVCHNLFEIDS